MNKRGVMYKLHAHLGWACKNSDQYGLLFALDEERQKADDR